jgi:hypothetical protein
LSSLYTLWNIHQTNSLYTLLKIKKLKNRFEVYQDVKSKNKKYYLMWNVSFNRPNNNTKKFLKTEKGISLMWK